MVPTKGGSFGKSRAHENLSCLKWKSFAEMTNDKKLIPDVCPIFILTGGSDSRFAIGLFD